MSIRHTFVVFVAVSLFAMQLLLFAREGGQSCTPSSSKTTWKTETTQTPTGTTLITTTTTTDYFDGVCVDDSYAQCDCYTWDESPKRRVLVVVRIEGTTHGSIGGPDETGTHVECDDAY